MKILLATMTKEPFQLARIYYDLFHKEKIQQIFSKLRCIEYDQSQDRWVWLCDGSLPKHEDFFDKQPRWIRKKSPSRHAGLDPASRTY